MLSGFLLNNYFNILLGAFSFCKEHNVTKHDILLEIDFFGDAPALRGDFNFGLVDGYIRGNRPSEPEWYPDNLWRGIRDKHKRMAADNMLTVCRYPDDSAGASNIGLRNPSTGLPMMSSAAMNAVGTANADQVLRIFGPEGMIEMARQIRRHTLVNPGHAQRVLRDVNF